MRLIQPENGSLHLYVQEALPADFVAAERCVERDECLCGEAAQRQRGGVYALRRHVAGQEAYRCARIGFATIGVFPIRFGNQPLGVFNLYFPQPREFTSAQRQMLETIGQHLGIALESQRLASREREMAISEERNLLAQELHDSIAQSLAFLNIQAQMLEDSVAHGLIDQARTELAQIREGIQASYDDVRELLVHFRTRFAQADIESAIASSLERFEGQTGIRSTFVQSGAAMPLSPEIQIQVLHIIQECLSNARKHAGAQCVRVDMQRGPRYLFRIGDDGRGFDPAQVTSDMHVGLAHHARASTSHRRHAVGAIAPWRWHRSGARAAGCARPGRGGMMHWQRHTIAARSWVLCTVSVPVQA